MSPDYQLISKPPHPPGRFSMKRNICNKAAQYSMPALPEHGARLCGTKPCFINGLRDRRFVTVTTLLLRPRPLCGSSS